MTCHQCDDAQVAELKAALVNARGELIASLAEEKAAVEAADRLTKERDEAVEALESLEAAILEVLPYQYDDGTDEEADPGECLGYAAEELAELRKKVAAASALEAVIATSASVEAQLRQERDEARAEVERLLLERNAAFDDNARLRSALRSCADIGEARVAKVVRDALTQDFEKPADSVVTAGDLIGLRRE